MKNYSITQQNIFLPTRNSEVLTLYFTADSGKIVYRDKINTVIGIKHPGILLGVDQFGYRWILHHHYKNIQPTIDREDAFSEGAQIFYDNRKVFYNQLEIIQRGLRSWWNGRTYHWLLWNCQHFINDITRNEHKSEALDKISDGVMLLGGAMTIIGLLTGNKAVVAAGLIAMGGGVAGWKNL